MSHQYLKWNQQTVSDFSEQNIARLYDQGYLFGRIGKGVMNQTRSVRVDLKNFTRSSENRRILRKVENIKLKAIALPHQSYHWSVGKMAKDFYSAKFGDGTFSANKIKELLTEPEKSNFNQLFVYKLKNEPENNPEPKNQNPEAKNLGFCVCLQTSELLHYCYPFYDLENSPKNMGLGMMTQAVIWAKATGRKYIYLGSASRSGDVYKLQFEGLEWFDGQTWKNDLAELKNILKNS